MQARPGTYALVLRATESTTVTAGRLGTLHVVAGDHVYIGSAFGPGGVRARVQRHARAEKRLRWHIDHLTTVAPVVEAWFTHDPRRLECDWLAALASIRGARELWPGFGASDCGCSSHLRFFRRAPRVATFRRWLRGATGRAAAVGCWKPADP